MLVTFSAVGTALLMLRFLQLVGRPREEAGRARLGLLLPFAACVASALAIPWLLFPGLSELAVGYALKPASLWAGLWPVLTGAVLLAGMARSPWRPKLAIPEGDLVIPLERGSYALVTRAARLHAARLPRIRVPQLARAGQLIDRMERHLASWRVAGTLLLILAGSSILLVGGYGGAP
jgi:hydrogenase-4 component B